MDKELESYRNQLASNPDDAEALARLEAALLRSGDWEGLVALTAERSDGLEPAAVEAIWVRLIEGLEQHAAQLDDPSAASAAELVVGQLWEQRLGRPDEAMLRYQRAFQLDAANVAALAAAREIYVGRGNWELVLQLYNLELEAVPDASAQADLYLAMAQVCAERLERSDDAVMCVRQALKLVPDHPGAGAYAELLDAVHHDRQARVDELVSAAEATRDPRQRAALLIEAAGLWFEEAPADGRIRELLDQVLAADPRNEHARILLEQFFEANQRWDDLTDHLVRRAEATARKADRLAIYQRLADIAGSAAGDPARAVEWHLEVLKLNPVEADSLNYCVDYFSDNARWLDLVAVYEAALRTRQRGGDESAMLVQIAMILWKKVADLDAAENYFKRIKLNDPRNALMLQFYSEFYTAQADWKRLLSTLAARQNNESSVEARISLGLEMAEVAEQKLDNPAKAIDIWKSILKVQPDHAPARDALRRLFFQTGKWNALLEFLKEDLGLAPDHDVARKVAIYEQIIEIYRDQLNLPVMVINTYNQILQVDPTNAGALDALQQKYEAAARWNDLIGILGRRADVAREAGDEDKLIELYRQIAELWLEKFSNPTQAIRLFEGILEVRPADEQAIAQLIEIYRHRKEWPALYAIYRKQLDLLDGPARVERLVEMAKIAASRLDQKDEAIELWRQVVAAEPEREKPWQALEALFQKTERFADLAELYAARAARLEAEEERLAWLKKLGNIYAEKLADEESAAATWRDVLRLAPGDLHAENYLRELYLRRSDWSSLETLYGERGDWEGFIRLLSGAAGQSGDVAVKVDLYRRMARVCRVNLENEAAAVECWERVLQEDPDNLDAARTLAPHYARAEAWDALVGVLEVVLRNGADDPVALMVELAQVHEERRGDAEQAYLWYAQALQAAPDRAELLAEAERAAAACEAWDALVDLLDALVGTVEGAAAEVRLRRVLAAACAEHLGRNADASAHYERVRALDGDSRDVLDALGELYQKLSRWDDLLEVYTCKLDRADEPAEQARILEAIGELHESVRDDVDAAREAFERLRAVAPNSVAALRGLQRIAERMGDVRALAEYVSAELDLATAPDEIASLLFRLGQLDERQGRLEEALEAYARVLKQEPEHVGAVQALEQFLDGAYAARAAFILEPYLRAHEEWSSLRRVLELQVEGSADAAFRAQRLREVARIREERLSDPRGAFLTWKRLLVEERQDATVRTELERLATELGAWEELTAHYARFGLGGDLSDGDVSVAVLYSRRLATLQEERLACFADARETLRLVLDEQGDDLETLEAVDRLTTRLEDWRGLVDVCERKLALLDGSEARLEMLFRVADLWEEVLDEPDQAVVVYRRALEDVPGNERAIASLDRILRNVGRWQDLADLLRDRLADARGEARIPLGYQLAQVLEHQLDAPEAALERYAEVLEQAPDHEPTVRAIEQLLEGCTGDDPDAVLLRRRACDVLEPIYEMAGDWQSSIHLLQVRLNDAADGLERMALHVRIARIYEESAQDATAAFASHGAAFGEQYGNPEVLAELLRLAEALDAWSALAAVLRRGLDDGSVADHLDPVLRREMLGRVAGLYEDRVGDLGEAIAFNRRILEEDERDMEALASLDRLYQRADDVISLVEVVERRAELTMEAPAQAALYFRLGALFEDRLDDLDRAVEVHARIREIDPEDLRAHEALERLHARRGEFEPLVEVLLDHAERLDDLEARKALLFRAAATYEDGLGRPDDAVDVYRRIAELDPDDREALAHLDRLFGELERHADLLDVLAREQALAGSDADLNHFEYRTGVLLRDHLEELSRAVSSFEAVLGRDASHGPARAALEGLLDEPEVRLRAARILIPLYEADEQWDRLRDTLRGTLRDVDLPDARVETLQRIALIEEAYLDDAASAFESLSEAYEQSEAAESLELELERLAAVLGCDLALADLMADVVGHAPARAVTIHLKIAAIAEDRLGDVERAIREHREVLELEPDDRRALNALERLYERAGDHLSLVEILERKAELAAGAGQRKPLFERIARLQEDVLDDSPAAVETWRRVVADDEADTTALDNLERLLAQGERWGELAALYEHRLAILPDPVARAEYEYRLARTCETKLLEGERALDLYRQILSNVPHHRATREALAGLFDDADAAERAGVDRLVVAGILEPLYREDHDFAALVPVLEARQEAAEDDSLGRVALLREIAGFEERELGSLVGAFEACARALRLMPEDAENRRDLHRLAEHTGRYEALAGHLEEVAATLLDPTLKVALLLELGRARRLHLGEDEAARDVYREVLEIEPGNDAAVAALVELFTDTAAWEDLVQLYLDLAEGSTEPEEQKRLYFKVCELLEDVVDDAGRAIETYRRVLEIEPDNARAFKALERFYSEAARWVDLADLLRTEIEYADEGRDRAELRYRLGAVLETQLEDLDGAIEAWRRVLEDDHPEHAASLEALERLLVELSDLEAAHVQRQRVAEILEPLYSGREQWSDWVMVAEVQLELQQDPWQRLETLTRIAQVQEHKLQSPAAAFNAYARAFAQDYGNPDLQAELDRLAAQLGAWAQLVDVYLAGIEAHHDLDAAVSILLKVARTFDARLGDADRAIDCYRRVLLIEEANGEALDALERILGNEGRHQDLVTVLARKADFADALPEKKALLYRVSQIWEDVLDRPDQAIETWRRIFEEDPDDQDAVEALIRLYERTAQWELLVEMLREKLEAAAGESQRKAILYRIARTYEEQLQEPDETILTYRSVLEADPRDRKALEALDRLYSREGRWGELIDLLETERDQYKGEDQDRVDTLELRIADVLQHQLGQVEQAIELYGEILERSPTLKQARKALEHLLGEEDYRLAACRVLEPHYRDRNQPEALARVYELELLDLDDRAERLDLLKRLAKLRYEVLKHPRSAYESYARAFQEEPGDPEIVEALHDLADELSLHAELARLHQEQVAATLDGEVVRGLNRRLARLYDYKLGEQARAIETWQAVLDADSYDAEALAALDRLYQTRQNWPSLIEVLKRRIDVGGEPQETLDLRFRLGYLLEVVEGDVAQAIDHYRTVLWEKPDHVYCREAMERLAVHLEYRDQIAEVLEPIYRDGAQWDKLAILTEMRIELSDDRRTRAQHWMTSASIREQKLGDADSALMALLRAFEELPEDEDVREELVRVATERGAWSDLVEAFEAAQRQLDEPDLQLEDHLRIATWCRGRLRDPGRAVAHYRAALEIDEANERALDALEELYEEAEVWPELAEIHRRKADALYDLDEKKARLHRLGELCAERLHDVPAAVAAYEQILEIEDADTSALAALERLHARAEDWGALAEVLERRAEGTYDGAELVVIHRRLGELARDRLADAERAAAAFERVLDLEPDDDAATVALRDLYTFMEDWERLQEVLVKELARVDGDRRLGVLGELGRNADQRLDRPENAIEYHRQVLAARPHDADTLDQLASLYERTERWYDLVEALREHLETVRGAGDQARTVALLVRIANIAEGRLGDADQAIETLDEVLSLNPNHAGALNVSARLYERRGDWAKAAETLERALEHGAAGQERAESWRRLGLLYLEHLDRPADARRALEAAVAEADDAEALEALLRLARDQGDDATVAALLERRLARAAAADRVPLLTEIAALRVRMEDTAGAITALEQAQSLAPEDLKVADLLLQAYFDARRFADAEPILGQIIDRLKDARRFKELFTYNFRMGCVAEERGDEAGALRYFTECFEYDATYVPNLLRLGGIHFRNESWEQALKIYQTVLLHQARLDRDGRVGVFHHLGHIRRALGDDRKARDMFNRALGLDPDHEPSRRALGDLTN